MSYGDCICRFVGASISLELRGSSHSVPPSIFSPQCFFCPPAVHALAAGCVRVAANNFSFLLLFEGKVSSCALFSSIFEGNGQHFEDASSRHFCSAADSCSATDWPRPLLRGSHFLLAFPFLSCVVPNVEAILVPSLIGISCGSAWRICCMLR